MTDLNHLIKNNRAWANSVTDRDEDFFERLSRQQAPEYLWIGCADSRVPANEIVGLLPGELFVHRNVANVVVHTDLNCLSVLQYAVDALKVRHIIVCGHYGCGGVHAVVRRQRLGLSDNWLRHVADVYDRHKLALERESDPVRRADALCELNVAQQVINVADTTVVQDAWQRGQSISVHGWIYGLKDGLVHDLNLSVSTQEELDERRGHLEDVLTQG